MPLVRIDLWPTVTRDQKKALIKNVTDAVVSAVGCPTMAVEILLNEVDKENWAQGGVTHAERSPVSAGD
ncbi:MAG: 2-hydroxymuconate tautomerase [Thermoleophilia bacterium]